MATTLCDAVRAWDHSEPYPNLSLGEPITYIS